MCAVIDMFTRRRYRAAELHGDEQGRAILAWLVATERAGFDKASSGDASTQELIDAAAATIVRTWLELGLELPGGTRDWLWEGVTRRGRCWDPNIQGAWCARLLEMAS